MSDELDQIAKASSGESANTGKLKLLAIAIVLSLVFVGYHFLFGQDNSEQVLVTNTTEKKQEETKVQVGVASKEKGLTLLSNTLEALKRDTDQKITQLEGSIEDAQAEDQKRFNKVTKQLQDMTTMLSTANQISRNEDFLAGTPMDKNMNIGDGLPETGDGTDSELGEDMDLPSLPSSSTNYVPLYTQLSNGTQKTNLADDGSVADKLANLNLSNDADDGRDTQFQPPGTVKEKTYTTQAGDGESVPVVFSESEDGYIKRKYEIPATAFASAILNEGAVCPVGKSLDPGSTDTGDLSKYEPVTLTLTGEWRGPNGYTFDFSRASLIGLCTGTRTTKAGLIRITHIAYVDDSGKAYKEKITAYVSDSQLNTKHIPGLFITEREVKALQAGSIEALAAIPGIYSASQFSNTVSQNADGTQNTASALTGDVGAAVAGKALSTPLQRLASIYISELEQAVDLVVIPAGRQLNIRTLDTLKLTFLESQDYETLVY